MRIEAKSRSVGGINKRRNPLFIYLYYLILLTVYVFLSRPGVTYSNSIRLLFFAATLLPALWNTTYFLFAIVCFYSMTYLAFTPILPTSIWYYLPVVSLYYIFYYKLTDRIAFMLPILLYFIFICVIYNDYQVFVSCFFVAILISSFIKKEEQLNAIAIALMVSSTILSILFYTNMDSFVYAYGSNHDQERYGWINPNEYAGAIGCGGVIAIHRLFSTRSDSSKWSKILCVLTLFTSTIVIVVNASRGAAISFFIVLILFTFFSKIKFKYKLFGILVVSGLFVFIFSNNIAAFLISRLGESSMATGTGRFDIWNSKFNWFINNANVVELFVGVGGAKSVIIPPVISTHNDFLTAFIGYGVIGILLFLLMLFYPLLTVNKNNRITVSILSLYLFLECFVLEPLFRGYFTFIIFYFYIFKVASLSKTFKETSP